MAKICPGCGLSVGDDPRFCPGCGAPLAAKTAVEQQNTEADEAQRKRDEQRRRIFVLKRKQYGDTVRFDETTDEATGEKEKKSALRTNLSLYFSVCAFVLSLIAVTLVVIFAIVPGEQRAAESVSSPAPTVAPTQAPTEPPITGTYDLYEIRGGDLGLLSLLLNSSKLEMQGDYTGSVLTGGRSAGSVTLDQKSDSAVFLDMDCTYTFDSKVLTISYGESTLIYKKEK